MIICWPPPHDNLLILDWCCMCKRNGESVDHLLILCSIAFDLWSMMFTLFGIHWVMPKTMVDLLACWQGKLGRHRNSAIWMAVPHCLMWCIWGERNNQHFADLERSIADLKLFFLKTLLDWVTVFDFRSFSSLHGFTDFCTLCTWFVFVLDVYFLYTQVTPLFFLIYSNYLSKKKTWHDNQSVNIYFRYISYIVLCLLGLQQLIAIKIFKNNNKKQRSTMFKVQ